MSIKLKKQLSSMIDTKLWADESVPRPMRSISPSAAKFWLNCPGWYKLAKQIPKGPQTAAMTMGTETHSAIEKAWTLGYNPSDIDKKYRAYDKLFDRLRTEYAEYSILCEAKIPHLAHAGIYDMVGYMDFVAIRNRNYTVFDVKNGKTVVEANDPQLLVYLVAVAYILGIDSNSVLKTVVFQPNAAHFDGIFREHVVSIAEYYDLSKRIRLAAKQNLEEKSIQISGTHCKYCCAEKVCPVKRNGVIFDSV